jgi:pyruvate formate lyase activating enzyme
MLCAQVCVSGVHRFLDTGSEIVHQIERKNCTLCGKCLDVCCYDALSLVGTAYTPGELYERIRGDLRYFPLEGKSGERGGITFSGGEPMLHYGFIRSFCELIPGVHRAMETSGFAPREYFEEVADSIDMFLFDYKITDGHKHTQYCGVDNAIILDNLAYLYSRSKEIVLRLPLIQGINDDTEHFDRIAELLRFHPKISRVEILPYHKFGIGKAGELGIGVPAELPGTDADTETVEKWFEALRQRGCVNVYRS